MRMNPYLSFRGDCEAALTYYAQHLGGTLGPIFRYAGSPMAGDVPDDWQDKVMHGSVTFGDYVVMGGDVAPERYEKPQGFSLSLQITSTSEAERIFGLLSAEGMILVPLEQTFWAARFGMVVDRFGVPWMINCEEAAQASGA
jgi:PhnB protein